jgi:hypothetical protein
LLKGWLRGRWFGLGQSGSVAGVRGESGVEGSERAGSLENLGATAFFSS